VTAPCYIPPRHAGDYAYALQQMHAALRCGEREQADWWHNLIVDFERSTAKVRDAWKGRTRFK